MTGTEAYPRVLRRIMYLVLRWIFCGSNQAKVFAYEGDGVDHERLNHSLIPENQARAARGFEKYTGLDQSDISALSTEDATGLQAMYMQSPPNLLWARCEGVWTTGQRLKATCACGTFLQSHPFDRL
jgi:hypothetical protein